MRWTQTVTCSVRVQRRMIVVAAAVAAVWPATAVQVLIITMTINQALCGVQMTMNDAFPQVMTMN